jgi:ABC-type branched-subunit amino acid transport system ATPase component
MLDAVAAVNRSGVTVIMIEQNLIEAMRVANDVVLLVAGEIKGTWKSGQFLSDPVVRELFLGGSKAKPADVDRSKVSNDASAA